MLRHSNLHFLYEPSITSPPDPGPVDRSALNRRVQIAVAEALAEYGTLHLRLRESDFFGTGPYFKRTRTLLAADPNVPIHARSRARLEAMLDYLETPAPIDSWKRFIGTEANKPRLVHLLAACGAELGLQSNTIGHSGVLHSASDDREAAIQLIERGEKRAAELATEPRT